MGAMRTLTGVTNSLAANNDLSTGLVDIGFDVNFYGSTYDHLYCNNNGNVTFVASSSVYTPPPFSDLTAKMIAVFLADVDTRYGTGLLKYGQDTVDGHDCFAVNWNGDGVMYHVAGTGESKLIPIIPGMEKYNKFQLILIDRSDIAAGDFDIEFNYDQIEWETGGNSGGTAGLGGNSARIGYSNAGTYRWELPGSGVNSYFLDGEATALVDNLFNSAVNGRYIINFRGGFSNFDWDPSLAGSGGCDGVVDLSWDA